MQPIVLNPKFDSQILNKTSNSFELELKSKFDNIFKNRFSGNLLGAEYGFRLLDESRPHIVEHPDLPGWIIKGQRKDLTGTSDTHIYRVRKALRIQNIIDKYHFTEVVVPQKFLYQVNNQWIVAAKKLNLNPNQRLCHKTVHTFNDTYTPLSPKAAYELAMICFLGRFEDLKEDNLIYTVDGKIALVDTEPNNRIRRKKISWLDRIWPFAKTTRDFLFAFVNTEKLQTMCETIEAKQMVRRVQDSYWKNYVTKLVAATAISVILGVGAILATAASAGPLLTGIAVATVGLASYTAIRSIFDIWLNCSLINYLRSPYGQIELSQI